MIEIKLLKFKNWLSLQPNYEGFMKHLKAWEQEGLNHGCMDLIKLAESYNCPIPKFSDGKMVFNYKPKTSIEFIEINFTIGSDGISFDNTISRNCF